MERFVPESVGMNLMDAGDELDLRSYAELFDLVSHHLNKYDAPEFIDINQPRLDLSKILSNIKANKFIFLPDGTKSGKRDAKELLEANG